MKRKPSRKPAGESPCITCERSLPPPSAHTIRGTWWKYSIRTRSGANDVTGFRNGSESDVKRWLRETHHKMEMRERPYGPRWRQAVLRPLQAADVVTD